MARTLPRGAEHRRSEQKLGGAVGQGGREGVGHERGFMVLQGKEISRGQEVWKKPNVDFFL